MPDGFVENDTDAFPNDPTETTDADGDGAGSNADADDNDPTVFPGAPEICGDGIDNNQNGLVDEECDVPVASCPCWTAEELASVDGILPSGDPGVLFCSAQPPTPFGDLLQENSFLGPGTPIPSPDQMQQVRTLVITGSGDRICQYTVDGGGGVPAAVETRRRLG